MTSPAGPALVLGASGQTGSFLLRHLVRSGQRAVAATRADATILPESWRLLGISGDFEHRRIDYCDAAAVEDLIANTRPGYIYVLAGQSSVRRSLEAPAQTISSHTLPILNVLEAVRTREIGAKIIYASSVECFGRPARVANECAPFDPRSPYAAGKVTGTVIVRSYRRSFGLACCTVFLSNHESALRSADFLFGKVLAGLDAIVNGRADIIETGSLGIRRDFGYAPEFAEGLAAVAAGPCDVDLTLATGHTVLLRDAVHDLYREFGVDPAKQLAEGPAPRSDRPEDFAGWDISRARATIGWRPRTWFPKLAAALRADWTDYRAAALRER